MKITGNEPALPCNMVNFNEAGRKIITTESGLTIRQQFAMNIMSAVLNGVDTKTYMSFYSSAKELNMSVNDYISVYSIEKADALINKLNDTPNPNQ